MLFENEEYMKIKDYEDYYISANGQVISKKPGRNCYSGEIKKLNPVVNQRGYYQYYMIDNHGNKKSPMQHQLIMRTFVPNPKSYPHINHKDGDKLNNTTSNLEWCSPKHNTQHAWDTGLRNSDYCKKKIHQYSLEGKYLTSFDSIAEASNASGSSKSDIVSNAKGRIASSKGHMYSYEKLEKLPKYTKHPVTKSIDVKNLLSGEVITFSTLVEASTFTGLHSSKFLRRFKKSNTFIIEHFQITKTVY